ncbi:hypothetical protein [Microbacterium bovistercoris]|uniref:hypothetical protein n=1 Tax=Microbacterium bovistercoris TaxID=2293570 RepID=UPI0015F290AE|nr:hypothetical protein [Microbacterium bovistercoris]
MTRARVGIVTILAGLLIAVGAAVPASADTTDDLIAVDDTLTTAASTFYDAYSDQSAPVEDVVAAADAFAAAAEKAESDYKQVADSASGQFADYANAFSGEAGDMAEAASGISAAISAEDQAALGQAETDFNAALDAYNTTVDEYNEFLETAPEARMADPTVGLWLVILIISVVFLILTLVFALLTRKQEGLLPAKADKKGNVQQPSLKKLRWMVVLWAGVFVVGAAIPFFQVMFAPPEQTTYTIFWYPLAAGVILSIVGVVQYFMAAAKVRREGSAQAYDPNDPSTLGTAQGEGFVPVPPAPGDQPAPPAYQAQGAPVPPAPAASPAPAPVADAPAPAADAPAPAAPSVDAPAAPSADSPAAPAADAAPAN